LVMQDFVYIFYSLVIGALSFLLGYSIRRSTIRKIARLIPKKRPTGAVFKAKTQEEIRKEQAKEFYDKL